MLSNAKMIKHVGTILVLLQLKLKKQAAACSGKLKKLEQIQLQLLSCFHILFWVTRIVTMNLKEFVSKIIQLSCRAKTPKKSQL